MGFTEWDAMRAGRRWQGCYAVWRYKDAVLCVAIQPDVNFVLGCVCETLGFTEWDALHTILVRQNLVPHWYTNEYKNTLIASMLFFILCWQIKFLDGRGLEVRGRPPCGPPSAGVLWGCSSWTGARFSVQPLPWFYPGPMGDP